MTYCDFYVLPKDLSIFESIMREHGWREKASTLKCPGACTLIPWTKVPHTHTNRRWECGERRPLYEVWDTVENIHKFTT